VRSLVRRAVGVLVVIHGLIHVMGSLEGFGWARLSRFTEPITTVGGFAWLIAGVSVVASGAMLISGARGWWAVATVAALASQCVITTSWTDAKAGTAVNIVLLVAAIYGFRAHGPTSYRAQFRRLSNQTVSAVAASSGSPSGPVTEADLEHLPPPVADYLRAVGAVGRPHVLGFRAAIRGRIRSGSDQPWMPWTGAQVNTFGSAPSRVFYMDATMKGLPTDVLHAYVGPTARMQVRLASLKTIIDASGPEMDQAETVTLLNDMCVLAPAALVDARIEWTPVDDHRALATFTNAGHKVSATLTFDDDHELVDFVSDDRSVSSRDGRSFSPQRWSTPIADYRSFNGRRVGAFGRAQWHPADEPAFDYLEFHADDISYLEAPAPRA